jgi:triosephosphate isomerase
MITYFVNLKRFDIPRALGGVCPSDNPTRWLETVIEALASNGRPEGSRIVLLLPESLLATAVNSVAKAGIGEWMEIGSQSVVPMDAAVGKNFGAFTGMRTAKSMRALGCGWTLIGHSEEKANLLRILSAYDTAILEDAEHRSRADSTIMRELHGSLEMALRAGLQVLICIGETARERGTGPLDDQMQARIREVLDTQLDAYLAGLPADLVRQQISIAYEPVWAIGPGKTPPDAAYIAMVAGFILEHLRTTYAQERPVVYGGGLKEENAAAISSVDELSGGLIALTRFAGEIGFYTEDFIKIVHNSHWHANKVGKEGQHA